MFQNPKYLTRGIQYTLPAWLVILLWHLIDRIPDDRRDYLQVFRLDAHRSRTAHRPLTGTAALFYEWTFPAATR